MITKKRAILCSPLLAPLPKIRLHKNHTQLSSMNPMNSMYFKIMTKEYLMVIEYADGNLHDLTTHSLCGIKQKLAYVLASSLDVKQNIGIIYCGFHPGNVLVFEYTLHFKS